MLKYLKKKFLFEDHVCPWWLAYSWDNRIRNLFHNPDKILKPFVKDGMTVLDIGCGMGFFSIGMARFIGDKGKVYAVDIQKKMIDITKRRSQTAGVADRIIPILTSGESIGVSEPIDFALSFWMVHEVPDQLKFLKDIYRILKPSGTYLIAEPKLHVNEKKFDKTVNVCREIGFQILDYPKVTFSRGVLLKK
ncbi:MAG: hypothetical protein A2V66_02145 [Ignavibacteria bacterium RBG_13_36_8]|nr:MAG: hypothetical protein A2V66_02145 [Ignavibacteria bacterium RBG_13_36_8]